MMRYLNNRSEAGALLAAKLQVFANDPGLLVLALPRGGVPVGFEVAKSLNAPLDVYLVRKLGVPGHEELAMGAISSGGTVVTNHEVVQALNLSEDTLDRVAHKESRELARREALYRKGRPPLALRGRTVLLIDDGLATGSTMQAALEALHKQEVAKIVVAVPVAPRETCDRLKNLADAVVCLYTPEPFWGVGQWYKDFSQTTDEEVIDLLRKATRWQKQPSPQFREVTIPLEHVHLEGKLLLCQGGGQGIVLFVHGSGSSRHSPRNEFVAQCLYQAGFSSLLFDLLTAREEIVDRQTRHLRFDISLLAQRLAEVTHWVRDYQDTGHLPIGYFGASTGAAAALRAAAGLNDVVKAIVSRGGRPDLADEALSEVTAPTLLLVGGRDTAVLDLNRVAQSRMKSELAKLEVVPEAGHLFEESGALERVAELATQWFAAHLKEDTLLTIPRRLHFTHQKVNDA